jgi:hypothetical protein
MLQEWGMHVPFNRHTAPSPIYPCLLPVMTGYLLDEGKLLSLGMWLGGGGTKFKLCFQ